MNEQTTKFTPVCDNCHRELLLNPFNIAGQVPGGGGWICDTCASVGIAHESLKRYGDGDYTSGGDAGACLAAIADGEDCPGTWELLLTIDRRWEPLAQSYARLRLLCGHEGCDYTFDDEGQRRDHWAEHRAVCIDITNVYADCGFCNVTKSDQIDAYLSDESVDHPFCDSNATDEDGNPAECHQCSSDIRGRQVTRCGSLYPDNVFCSIGCLRNFIACEFETAI